MLGVAFLTKFCFISGRHKLPTSSASHSFISTYFLLLFSICLCQRVQSRRGWSWEWIWNWDWAWPRLAFGLSGTLFDDAFRDFFALECLIFISRILYGFACESFSFLLRLFQRFPCLALPVFNAIARSVTFCLAKTFPPVAEQTKILKYGSKSNSTWPRQRVTPCLPACSGCSRSFGGFAKVDSENQYLFESK